MEAAIYHYVGPDHLRGLRREAHCIKPGAAGDLLVWTAERLAPGKRSGLAVATFVVDIAGDLWIADRRSEHVACADGGPVMAAGEMTFERDGANIEVIGVSNQSTGFCPESACWPVVAAALDRIGVSRPGDFTEKFTFRRCTACGGINLIKDGLFECGECGRELPEQWNF